MATESKHLFRIRYIIGLLLHSILVISCVPMEDCGHPVLFTEEVTEISSHGAVFAARQMDLCECEFLESGFVWDVSPNPTIETAEKFYVREAASRRSFRTAISTTLIKDQIYYVRSFIKSEQYFVYGNEVAFSSKGSIAPIVTDFEPKEGNLGDTITITGSHFSYSPEMNKVLIGGQQCRVLTSKQDTITAIVSNMISVAPAPLSVSILGHVAKATELFLLEVPLFTDFNNKSGSYHSEVTLIGDNFLSSPETLEVKFHNFKSEIIDIKDKQLIVKVPEGLNVSESSITVSMNNIEVFSEEKFHLTPVQLLGFNPQRAISGQAVKLNGENFSPIPENNTVTIGGIPITVINSTSNELVVRLPLQDHTVFPSRHLKVQVEVAGQTRTFVEDLIINDQWFRLKDAPEALYSPGYGYHYVSCFASDSKAYIGLNNSRVFFEYNPQMDEWKRLSSFPGDRRFNGAGFVIGDKLFFGTGSSPHPQYVYYKDWWSYNMNTDTWSQLNNFYGKERTGAFGFKSEAIGYVGTGLGSGTIDYLVDVWKYDVADDSWARVADFPAKMAKGVALSTDAYTYVGMGREFGSTIKFMYRYLSGNDRWEGIPDFPQGWDDNEPLGFVIQNQIYVSLGYWYPFFKFDGIRQMWEEINRPSYLDFRNSVAFSIAGKAYVGLGTNNQMWEFDPSRHQ